MSKSPKESDYTYDVTLRIRSSRPYTTTELERLASWWVFIRDRQVKVEQVKVATTKGGKGA